jgi:hypothetical protein
MELPSLRHFSNRGIYTISSDPVEALVGEAWVPAIYTDRGWATADGASLLPTIGEWRNPQAACVIGGNQFPQTQATTRRRRRTAKA